MRHHTLLLLLGLLTIGLTAACSDPEVPPPLSLDAPTDITVGRTCLGEGDVGQRLRQSPEDCTGELAQFGYVANRLSNSLAVVNLNERIPELIDSRKGIPGVSHIPVGQGPTLVRSSADGNLLFVFNELDQDISVVSADQRIEIDKIPVGEAVSDMLMVTPSEDRPEELWLLTPNSSHLRRLTWTATCDGDAAMREGCDIQVEPVLEDGLALAQDTIPFRATLGPAQDRIYLTYRSQATLDEVLLRNTDEDQCPEGAEGPCVLRRMGLTTGCADGIDNDGDGLVDAQDPQCLSPMGAESDAGVSRVRVSQCNDGIDNDGDGTIDGLDFGCSFAGDGSETGSTEPSACNDGIDNDGDGDIDSADANCAAGPWHNREDVDANTQPTPGATACNDGIDNDQDGSIDGQDPGCASPDDDSETPATTACNDGIDNDGDGNIDTEDTACFGVQGLSESFDPRHEFGPVAIDPEGKYAYVIDRIQSQVIILDLATGQILDPRRCVQEFDGQCRDRIFEERIGVDVGRLATSIGARRENTRVEISRSNNRCTILTREAALANVGTTRGLLYFVEAAQKSRVIVEDCETGEELEEITTSPEVLTLRLQDASRNAAEARQINCTLTEETSDRIREARGENARGEILCTDPLLPSLSPVDVPCDGDAEIENCVCEDEDNTQCFLTFEDSNPVQIITRPLETLVLVKDSTETALVDLSLHDDSSLVNDVWRVLYEGALTEPQDVLVHTERPGWIGTSTDLCAADVKVGDLVTFTSAPVALPSEDCEAFTDRDLTWRVAQVQASELRLEVIPSEEADTLNHSTEFPLVDTLPTRGCFAEAARMTVRPHDLWIVRGDNNGILSSQRSQGQTCVPAFNPETRFQARLAPGDTFANPYFSFILNEGSFTPPQDFALFFSTRSNFSARNLEVGPSPVTIKPAVTSLENYLFVLDAGSNLLYIYDNDTSSRLTVLF